MDTVQAQTDKASVLWGRMRASLPTLSASEKDAVYEEMHDNAKANADFYVLIVLASLIAYIGLIEDSEAVIIGAMLVAPLMSPMMAMAYSVLEGNLRMFKNATLSTLTGIVLVVGMSALFTLLLPSPKEFLGTQVIARTQPTLLDLAIALFSGAAGAYALSRRHVAAALPGVAIAAALVPPLCVVGLGVGLGDWEIAGGALLLFLTNLASVMFAGSLVFLALGLGPARAEDADDVRRRVLLTIAGVILVAVPLSVTTVRIAKQRHYQAAVEELLSVAVEAQVAEFGEITVRDVGEGYEVDLTIYAYDNELLPALVENVHGSLQQATKKPVTVRVRTIQSVLAQYGSTP